MLGEKRKEEEETEEEEEENLCTLQNWGDQAVDGGKTAIRFSVKQTGCDAVHCVYRTWDKKKQCGTCEHETKNLLTK